MDQPRHVRIAAIQNEKNRKVEQEKARLEKIEKEWRAFNMAEDLASELRHEFK